MSLKTSIELAAGASSVLPKSEVTDIIGKKHTREKYLVLFGGILLAFNAGYLNGVCLAGFIDPDYQQGVTKGQSVAGFTGAYTNVGLSTADGDGSEVWWQIKMIMCFIGGAFLSGVINPTPKPWKLQRMYPPLFILGSVLLFAAFFFSKYDSGHRYFYYFAAAANGVQNGMSSMYSANLLRTTHMTGTSTDIGMFLGQWVRGNTKNRGKLGVLLLLVFGFVLGSLVAWEAGEFWRSESLLLSAILFACIGLGCLFYMMVEYRLNLWEAATGRWEWERSLEELHRSATGTDLRETAGTSGDIYLTLLRNLFGLIDEDGSGTITEHELAEALLRAGLEIDDDALQHMIKFADKNDDGLIQESEWEEMAAHMAKQFSKTAQAKISAKTQSGLGERPRALTLQSLSSQIVVPPAESQL